MFATCDIKGKFGIKINCKASMCKGEKNKHLERWSDGQCRITGMLGAQPIKTTFDVMLMISLYPILFQLSPTSTCIL